MLMFKVRFKWICFLITGLFLHLSFFILTAFIGSNLSFKSIMISLGMLFSWLIILGLFSNVSYSYNILWSPIAVFKKRKFIFHNKLGYFLIFISDNSIDVIDVKYLYLKEKISIKNTGNLKEMVKEMKEKLDEAFKTHLINLQFLEEKRKNIKVIKEWDGLLIDADERRDNKIEKILKK